MSQNADILSYLEAGNTLTPLEALKRFQCMRLASRISDLRNSGVRISSEMRENLDTGKRYAEYFLVKD
jgi:hypothetical protein